MNDATLMEDTGKAGAWRQRLAAPEPVASLRRARNGLGNLLSRCPLMTEVFNQIERVAPTRVSVLVTGESGTGKELVARTIHECSGRSSGPFVAVNCGAIPASLIEAELFGHERGSFTGAIRTQIGYFERAGGGTLFLDEIGEMPLEMQVKLLRALESGVICRIGGEREMPVEARVIAATNRNPAEAVAQGRLRADLLYRLAVFSIQIPPLRERGDDVELLARHFLACLNRAEGSDKRLSSNSEAFLREHDWPGNVRELYNVVQRAFIMADRELDLRGAFLGNGQFSAATGESDRLYIKHGMTLAEVERVMILETLKRCHGNKTRAAALLGISLKTLYNRLNEYRALE
ncbi:MAG: sigma-54-dependent Fis family transcriptional regulator [Proteobacteria bacterium]|nr:MAG: sigma-54-dependent Fis family transcriptional regulator [Pseudomonadota bacterium]